MQQTPLIQLKNIGKIYVSDGNVAVGIRGVDLSFNKGEFVAVTGASGSGKSTLLNVISGMDTYEEGEMLVEGEPTSHYDQKDWERFREDYISFIFQDYNILESFTVLQNVELALLHIEDPAARRARALELLRRVGMESHVKHKGSKLSGGQKQRTVIARALAKDSPIILADEPTGNLDSKSSREIIELLREISRDKLVIIVTHNFDEVEHCATRHVRIFDGAVELDHTLAAPAPVAETRPTDAPAPRLASKSHTFRRTLRDGFRLGRTRFVAKPKLSIFLCCLMTVAALVITFMTATSYSATDLFDKTLMFTHMDGRLVVVREDGQIMDDAEFQKLAADVGASDSMHYDFMLDRTVWVYLENEKDIENYRFSFGYPAADVKLDAGRYPEADNEVILEVPISAKPFLGQDGFEEQDLPVLFDMATYRVVGVSYYYDNTRTPRMLFTETGYKIASAIAYFSEEKYNFTYGVTVGERNDDTAESTQSSIDTYVDFGLSPGTYYANMPYLTVDKSTPIYYTLMGNFSENGGMDYEMDYYFDGSYGLDMEIGGTYGDAVYYPLDEFTSVATLPENSRKNYEKYFYSEWEDSVGIPDREFIALSPDILLDFMYEHYYEEVYTQGSLFFDSDREAHDKVETLREMGYIAVVSDETVEADLVTLIISRIALISQLGGWILTVFLATMLLYLCTARAMNAVRGDIAIMRSMGIPAGVIRTSIHVETFLSLIPALIITAIGCVVIYTVPATNAIFTFLHAPDYIILAVALIAVAVFLSRKQARRMFHDSVKKTMKGGKKS